MAITLDGTVGVTSPDFIPSSSNIPTNGLFLPTANTVGLATGSTERLRIDSSGNLGLGVTPSAWATISSLQVKNASLGGYQNNLYLNANAYYDGAWKYVSTGYASRIQVDTGAFSWYTAPSGTAGAAISFTQAMTLDASGNLGIGTTSPGSRLEVYSASAVYTKINSATTGQAALLVTNNSGANNFYFGIDTSSGGAFGSGAYGRVLYSDGAYPMVFYTNSSERARIDSSGNLLVGQTTSGPTVTGTSIGSGGYVTSAFNITSVNQAWVINNNNATGTTYLLEFRQNNVAKGSISVSSTATAYNVTSDQRLKIDLGVATDISVIDNTVIRDFEWKDGGAKSRGVFAQEAYLVNPSAVTVGKSEDLNDNGMPIDPWSVDYSKYVPDLIVYCQQLKARIEALEAK